jgi:CBS domain containing-hemolysin-like protein
LTVSGVFGLRPVSDGTLCKLRDQAGDLPDVDVGSDPKVTRRSDGSLLVDAAMPSAAPVGVKLLGFVLAQLGDVPRPEISSLGRMAFSVVEIDGRWIDKLLVEPT